MVPSPAKLAYRVSEVCNLAGVSRWAVEQAIAGGAIRTKRVGRALLLDPRDVSQVFGFAQEHEEIQPSAESIAEMQELLAS